MSKMRDDQVKDATFRALANVIRFDGQKSLTAAEVWAAATELGHEHESMVPRVEKALDELVVQGLVVRSGTGYKLSDNAKEAM